MSTDGRTAFVVIGLRVTHLIEFRLQKRISSNIKFKHKQDTPDFFLVYLLLRFILYSGVYSIMVYILFWFKFYSGLYSIPVHIIFWFSFSSVSILIFLKYSGLYSILGYIPFNYSLLWFIFYTGLNSIHILFWLRVLTELSIVLKEF